MSSEGKVQTVLNMEQNYLKELSEPRKYGITFHLDEIALRT